MNSHIQNLRYFNPIQGTFSFIILKNLIISVLDLIE